MAGLILLSHYESLAVGLLSSLCCWESLVRLGSLLGMRRYCFGLSLSSPWLCV